MTRAEYVAELNKAIAAGNAPEWRAANPPPTTYHKDRTPPKLTIEKGSKE